LTVLNAATESELESTFAAAKQRGIAGLSVELDPFFGVTRSKVMALVASYGVLTMWYYGYIVRESGLLSYAPDLGNGYHQAGLYAGKILRGEHVGLLMVVARAADIGMEDRRALRWLVCGVPIELVVEDGTDRSIGERGDRTGKPVNLGHHKGDLAHASSG
jgi:putative tryptophan/tyrosine transport system substrate-binding protein